MRNAAVMLNLFSLRGLPWSSGADGQEKVHLTASLKLAICFIDSHTSLITITSFFHFQVQLTAAELESLRSELADIEEREAHLKAR